jgi:hypothetical protein
MVAICRKCQTLDQPQNTAKQSTSSKNSSPQNAHSQHPLFCQVCHSFITLPGTRIELDKQGDEKIQAWKITSSYKSWLSLFLVPFTLIWLGATLGGFYLPQLIKGKFFIIQSLFGIPFLLAGSLLVLICLITLFGRSCVTVNHNQAIIFIGIGTIGWYRRFAWHSVKRVKQTSVGQYKYISLKGKQTYNFGWGLSPQTLYYVAAFIRSQLVH